MKFEKHVQMITRNRGRVPAGEHLVQSRAVRHTFIITSVLYLVWQICMLFDDLDVCSITVTSIE